MTRAYAARVLDGPSRPRVGPAQAREALAAGADTEFDRVVVRALSRILDTESEGYRMADDPRFAFPATRDARRPGVAAGEDPTGDEVSPGRRDA